MTTLSYAEPRCQGAVGRAHNALQSGSLAECCVDCRRRTEIVPGYAHHWMKPVGWAWFMTCQSRIAPVTEATESVSV